MVAPRQSLESYLAELLAEQGQLQTPVARFAEAHAQAPAAQLATLSSQLIPLTAPGPGEQYAFEVDLDACSGCKSCVAACHALNGLDDNESWRDVGLVRGGTRASPFQQTITSACHHCADPACLNGCPVLAYEKDPSTGIVRHLDDQCIGCQYCVLKCPYDVPKYSERLGVVRKCDLCHQRLGAGEAPACAQACPTEAIKIVKVSITHSPAPHVDTSAFLSVAPDPAYTQPTTRYVSARPLPANLVAADATTLHPQPPHWPLVLMLTFMPMAVGCNTLALLLPPQTRVTYYVTQLAWGAGALGLAASVFHLGQPMRAWRIFLGWRRSWLSREAMAFGLWFALASAACFFPALRAPAMFVGLLGLACSVMIYVDTRRDFWRLGHTAPRFFGSALLLGLAGSLAIAPTSSSLSLGLALVTLAKLALEAAALRPLTQGDGAERLDPAYQSARLLTGPVLRPISELRVIAGVLGGIGLPLLLAYRPNQPLAWLALGLCLAGEIAERYLYFRAVVAPKMPGVTR